ncbi:unnamed protein product [Linum trigynum]|uniref:Gnk2-homologous domain-containing protein n=1 Tax=Linum trigynum TaxID=586398 RepID=A0AAV2GEY0_9ROSI
MFCCLVSGFDDALCAGSDSTGTCTHHPLPASASQEDIFPDFADDFEDGDTPGCYTRDGYVDDDGFPFKVRASFSCDGAPSERCCKCMADGFVRMKVGCKGRAGGTVLSDDCCLRYETYNICRR